MHRRRHSFQYFHIFVYFLLMFSFSIPLSRQKIYFFVENKRFFRSSGLSIKIGRHFKVQEQIVVFSHFKIAWESNVYFIITTNIHKYGQFDYVCKFLVFILNANKINEITACISKHLRSHPQKWTHNSLFYQTESTVWFWHSCKITQNIIQKLTKWWCDNSMKCRSASID